MFVKSDASRIEQAIFSLVKNAIIEAEHHSYIEINISTKPLSVIDIDNKDLAD